MTDFPALASLLDPDEPPSPTPVVSDAEIGAARGYVEAFRAASTRRAYDGDWSRFSRWCHDRGAPACPLRPPSWRSTSPPSPQRGKRRPRSTALAVIADAHKRARLTACPCAAADGCPNL